jgi:hypothetical protein
MKSGILLLVAALFLFQPFAFAGEEDDEIIEFKNEKGTVIFTHEKHMELFECNICHHTGDEEKCKNCHNKDSNHLIARIAYHKQCLQCHQLLLQGPKKCQECHQRK